MCAKTDEIIYVESTVANINMEDALAFIDGDCELAVSSESDESSDVESQCESSQHDQAVIETPTDMQTLRQKLASRCQALFTLRSLIFAMFCLQDDAKSRLQAKRTEIKAFRNLNKSQLDQPAEYKFIDYKVNASVNVQRVRKL
jgi:hypothetical protein